MLSATLKPCSSDPTSCSHAAGPRGGKVVARLHRAAHNLRGSQANISPCLPGLTQYCLMQLRRWSSRQQSRRVRTPSPLPAPSAWRPWRRGCGAQSRPPSCTCGHSTPTWRASRPAAAAAAAGWRGGSRRRCRCLTMPGASYSSHQHALLCEHGEFASVQCPSVLGAMLHLQRCVDVAAILYAAGPASAPSPTRAPTRTWWRARRQRRRRSLRST